MSTVRTRFAPSPTGSLHVGGARTALYSWLYAKAADGKFLLRIEDTDRARSTEEATAGIVRDMAWLGLDWDEGPGVGGDRGPYQQSERLDLYNRHLEELLSKGLAYEAWDTREELTALREEARANKTDFRYRRRTPWTDAEIAGFRAEGRTPVVRLKAVDHAVVVPDKVYGDMTQTPAELEDFVIRKADGFPTYHFAVVVDDFHMGISHVLRGQEHLQNTTKHLEILERLQWPSPTHAHLPIINNMGGGKMSKRDKAKTARAAARQHAKANNETGWGWLAARLGTDEATVFAFMKKKNDSVALATQIAAELDVELPMIEVMDFRKGGFLPEALLNYLALLGWSAGDDREHYTLDALVEAFSIERVNRTPAKFDPVKLLSMNADWMRDLPIERYQEALDQWLEVVESPLGRLGKAERDHVVSLFKSRARTFVELEHQSAFMRAAPTEYNAKSVAKFIRKGGGLAHLGDARAALADVGRWERDSLEKAFNRLCEQTGTGLGKYAQPVRIAVSGSSVTPPLFDTLSCMDRDDVVARIDRAIAVWTEEE